MYIKSGEKNSALSYLEHPKLMRKQRFTKEQGQMIQLEIENVKSKARRNMMKRNCGANVITKTTSRDQRGKFGEKVIMKMTSRRLVSSKVLGRLVLVITKIMLYHGLVQPITIHKEMDMKMILRWMTSL